MWKILNNRMNKYDKNKKVEAALEQKKIKRPKERETYEHQGKRIKKENLQHILNYLH